MAADGVSFSIDVGIQAAGADTAAASLDTLTDKIAGTGDAAPEAAKALEDVGAAATDMGDAAEGGSMNMRQLSGALGKLGGPLGEAGSKAAGFAGGLQKMSKSIGAAGPYVALAVVVVALAASFALATVAALKFAIGAADTARTSALLSAGIARSVQGGKDLDATIAGLGNRVPQTREELTAMAADLANTGLRGAALSSALETAAVKAAKLKWGPDFAKQMLSLDSQSTRLKANVAGIFGGLNIDGLLEGLSKIVALFDSTSATGQAMKVVFESLFQPLIDGITAFLPKVITAFIGFEIWVMKAAIAIKPFASKILLLAEIVGGILAAAFGVLAVIVFLAFLPFIVATAVTVGLIYGLIWLGGVIVDAGQQALAFGAKIQAGIGDAFAWVKGKVQEVIDYLTNTSLSQIGSDMVAGLVNGIKSAGGAILTAITGAVQGAIDGAKKLLGIASPSKVFADIGMNTAAGMADGVDDHAGKVQGSLEDMVSPPTTSAGGGVVAPKGGAAAAAPAKSGGGNFSGAVFNFYGVQGAEDAEDRFLRMIEGDAASLGGAVPA